MNEQICPVCCGRGIVPNGFYRVPAHQPTFMSSNTGPETCRRCFGIGTIVASALSDKVSVVTITGLAS